MLERYDNTTHLPVTPFFLFLDPSDALLKMKELKKKNPEYAYNVKHVEVN